MSASFDMSKDQMNPDSAVVHVISDSLGDTATSVVAAAAGQFSKGSVHIKRLSKVSSVDEVKAYFDENFDPTHPTAVFHTIVDPNLRKEVRADLDRRGIPSIDLMGPAISVLMTLTGSEPMNMPGTIHNTDDRYFRRVDAMEFFVDHDDGRNTQDLGQADIVLLGVSRTSKTPLSMYLAFSGYNVANVPLAPGVEPPHELEDLDPGRVFGLLSTTETLSSIRQRRLADDAAYAAAASYADPAEISAEQQEARALMKKLGCIVIHTENKAVEETASEILDHIKALEAARAKAK